jgi:hypothetical protein
METSISPIECEATVAEIGLKDAALALVSRGFAVLPLEAWGEEPIFGRAFNLRETKDINQISEWGAKTPDANIGIATGAPSNVLVLEVNGPGEKTLKALEAQHGPLPDTLQASWDHGIYSGRHLYFRYPDDVEIKRDQLAPGIKIRADHWYVVAPPSVVGKPPVNGRRYQWVNDLPLADLPQWYLGRMAEPLVVIDILSLANEPPRRPLDPKIRSQIFEHFHGNVMRAFQTLAPDRPTKYLADQRYEISCSQNEFYKAMRGEEINGDFADFIEHLWLCTDTGDWRSDSLRKVPDDPKEWIKRHIGSIKLLHEQVFSDWSYPTLRNVVAGKGTEQNEQELRARLDRFRQRKRHELRAQDARDKLAAPEHWRRGGLAKRQQIATESRERKQEKMMEQG